MAEKVEQAVSDTVKTVVRTPADWFASQNRLGRHTFNMLDRATKGDFKGAKKEMKEAGKQGLNVVGGQPLSSASRVVEKRHTAAAEESKAEAAAKAAEFESIQSQKEVEARRKAAEERMARRQGTPGRPLFTTIGNRNSLL